MYMQARQKLQRHAQDSPKFVEPANFDSDCPQSRPCPALRQPAVAIAIEPAARGPPQRANLQQQGAHKASRCCNLPVIAGLPTAPPTPIRFGTIMVTIS
jgi:hypothetical protein